MNTTMTLLPHEDQHNAPVTTLTPRAATVYEAPARFDVYEVPALRRWVTDRRYMGHTDLMIDCSAVAFIDRAVVDAIAELDQSTSPLTISDASTATRITFELLNGAVAREAVAA